MPPDSVFAKTLMLLLSECTSSKTSCKEGKGKVSITPERGENVHFFHIDSDSGCRALKIDRHAPNDEGTVCDCLAFLGKLNADMKEYENRICLVELKGSDIEHAMRQIKNTHKHLWELLLESPSKDHLHKVIKKAYILRHGTTLKETKTLFQLEKELKTIFREFKKGRDSDLGPFLRG